MKQWCVYKHQNLINNKIYIGITSQVPEKRWRNGLGYYNHPKFYSAIKKYGWENFSHEILYEKLNEQEACKKEQELIKFYDSKNKGYNLTDGGEGVQGFHHNEITKQKISKTLKEKDLQRQREFIVNWNKNHREQRSEAMKKRWKDENFKTNIINKHKKKVICITTNQIFDSINEAAKWANVSPSNLSKCLKGVQHTAGKHPESKNKLEWKYL